MPFELLQILLPMSVVFFVVFCKRVTECRAILKSIDYNVAMTFTLVFLLKCIVLKYCETAFSNVVSFLFRLKSCREEMYR